MISFQDVSLGDKEWIEDLLHESQYRSCEYAFGTMFLWNEAYGIFVGRINDYVTGRSIDDDGAYYLYPAGRGDIRPVIDEILEDAKALSKPAIIYGLTPEHCEYLEKLYPDKFDFDYDRDQSEYIYLSEDLAELRGKKYHQKRNHINKFISSYQFTYEEITAESYKECLEMTALWNEEQTDEEEARGLRKEFGALSRLADCYDEVGLIGGLLRVDGKVAAYALGEPLTDDTFVVHIEKAYYDMNGAYTAINRFYVEENCMDYKYVNREEDMGIEGLRKAKLSYHPEILLHKYRAHYRG